jgi:hypothetical protein
VKIEVTVVSDMSKEGQKEVEGLKVQIMVNILLNGWQSLSEWAEIV